MITKSGVFTFNAPNMIVCGFIDSGRKMPVPKDHFPLGRIFHAERHFLLFKDQLA